MSWHMAVFKRLFQRTQYIVVTVTVLAAITKQAGIIKQNISFTFRTNCTSGLFM